MAHRQGSSGETADETEKEKDLLTSSLSSSCPKDIRLSDEFDNEAADVSYMLARTSGRAQPQGAANAFNEPPTQRFTQPQQRPNGQQFGQQDGQPAPGVTIGQGYAHPPPQVPPAPSPDSTDSTERLRPYFNQESMYLSNRVVDEGVEVWQDEVHHGEEPRSFLQPVRRGNYLEEDDETANRQIRAKLEKVASRRVGRDLPGGFEGAVAPDPNVSYGAAFRLVQAAVEAENAKDYSKAIDLYLAAGRTLVEVGKREGEGPVKVGLREKAFDLLKRAEVLQDYKDSQEALPEELSQGAIHMVEIDLVKQTWGSRPPPYTDIEFRNLRYTAVTSKQPITFSQDGFVLRSEQLQRNIKCFITVTMYNEDADEMKRTLLGIAKNLENLCEKWGADYWKSVAVCVVSDGRLKANLSTLDYLRSVGAFDQEIMEVTRLGVDVTCHLFETTLQLLASEEKNYQVSRFYPPLQFMYALKEHNAGKLDSHLWFFNAFAEQLQPKFTILVDVGTVPSDTAIFRLIRSMERNPQIAGVCGEIAVDFSARDLTSLVISSQHFEYKISNCMDKALESVFGFISVLPGAFSGYRYRAIRPENGKGPLVEYFKSLTTPMKELGAFKGNMYLAEDRILCFELISRERCNWTMHYVKDAVARTDVPPTLIDLIKQRRRWLNGSFFAGLYAILHSYKLWGRSGHSIPRRFVVTFQFLYLSLQMFLNWLLVGNLFLTFYYVLKLALANYTVPLSIILVLYAGIIMTQIIFGLGNKPEKSIGVMYLAMSVFMGLVMYSVTILSLLGLTGLITIGELSSDKLSTSGTVTCDDVPTSFIIFGAIASLGLIYLSALIHGEIMPILATTLQYFWMLPTYVNILGIYSYCNLHDLSWGTKGLETGGGHGPPKAVAHATVKDVAEQEKLANLARQKAEQEKAEVESKFRAFRSMVLCMWLGTNGVWVYVMTTFIDATCFLTGLTIIVAIVNIIRFLGSTIFIFFRMARRLCVCWKYENSGSYDPNTEAAWNRYHQEKNQAVRPPATGGAAVAGPSASS